MHCICGLIVISQNGGRDSIHELVMRLYFSFKLVVIHAY